MNVLMVYAHEEPKSFNGAMRNTAVRVLKESGHTVEVSDLYAMKFNPVGGRHDFTTPANPEFFKYGVEQTKASDAKTFVADGNGFGQQLLDLIGPAFGSPKVMDSTLEPGEESSHETFLQGLIGFHGSFPSEKRVWNDRPKGVRSGMKPVEDPVSQTFRKKCCWGRAACYTEGPISPINKTGS